MSKPTVILVPGAWHTPRHYEKLLELLRTAGFTTVSKQLPSVGSDQPTEQTVASDAAFIRESLLLPELDRGQDVILIMHSYGGSPGSAAAKGLSKAERLASGQKGGIVGLVFICAFLANEGDSLQSKLPGQKLDPWCLIDDETGQIDVEGPKNVFYSQTDTEAAAKAIENLKPHALSSFTSPSPPPAWQDQFFDGRRAYIKCHLDNTFPYPAQDAMVRFSGVEWHLMDLETADHSPFLNQADALCRFIENIAEKWVN